jgi:hypothetical protein
LAIPGFGRKGLNEVSAVLQAIELDIPADPSSRLVERLGTIRHEWERRRSARSQAMSAYDKPSGYLKREVYRLARDLIRFASMEGAMALLDNVRGRRARGRAADSLLHGLMGAVLTDEQLQRVEKSRYAEELQYALKHRVPEPYLVGFLLQIGSSSAARRDRRDADRFEAWYDDATARCVEHCFDT